MADLQERILFTTEEEEELSKAIQELANKVYDLHCDEAC